MISWTAFVLVLLAHGTANVRSFTSTIIHQTRFPTSKLYETPENFADVAATIADAAGALAGKTIVVKYGGVRSVGGSK
jgi:hypothetical protein